MLENLQILILSLADDELFMGHRHAEWIGLGPILEEDIAFASIAQDETGHAQAYYQILTDLGLPSPDEWAFRREPKQLRSSHLVELPNLDYDYAMALLRHFFYDAAEKVRLQALTQSTYEPLALLAKRLLCEEKYHWLHARTWIERLGRSTEEAQQRLLAARNFLWPYAWALFEPLPNEPDIVEAGWIPPSHTLQNEWGTLIQSVLEPIGLWKEPPTRDEITPYLGARYGLRSPYFDQLYAEFTEVSASDPQAEW